VVGILLLEMALLVQACYLERCGQNASDRQLWL